MAITEQQAIEIKSAGIKVHCLEEAKLYEAQAFITEAELNEVKVKFEPSKAKTQPPKLPSMSF